MAALERCGSSENDDDEISMHENPPPPSSSPWKIPTSYKKSKPENATSAPSLPSSVWSLDYILNSPLEVYDELTTYTLQFASDFSLMDNWVWAECVAGGFASSTELTPRVIFSLQGSCRDFNFRTFK